MPYLVRLGADIDSGVAAAEDRNRQAADDAVASKE